LFFLKKSFAPKTPEKRAFKALGQAIPGGIFFQNSGVTAWPREENDLNPLKNNG
jgi:hypothetical protein